jgi:hypothetical protein
MNIAYRSHNESVADINANGEVTLIGAGTTTITASFGGDATREGSQDSYELTVVDASQLDYYIGWATGNESSFDGFSALTAAQLENIATGYRKSQQQSITKTVTASEAAGNRQIFFVMWKNGSAPISGSVISGGIQENLSAADFLDTDVFRATHNDVVIDETTYHVAGMRGDFDEGDVFVVNF